MKGKGCFTNLTAVVLFLSFALFIGVSIFGLPQETYAATDVKVGNFQSGTTAVTTTVTGLTFQPKAVIFYWTRQSGTPPLIGANDRIGMGFAAGSPIDNRSIAIYCQDGADPYSNCARVRSETYSIMFLLNDTSLSGRGSVTSFNADGFTVTWESNRGINAWINYLAIGGDDITNVKAGTITATTSQTTQSFTGVGFQPDFVMFLASLTENVDTVTPHVYLNTGFMTNSTATEQAAVSVCGYDNGTNASTGDAQSQQRTTKAIMGMYSYCWQDWLASYYSMDADGFTLDFSDDAPTTDTPIFYLALQGGTHRIGAITQPTSTGTVPYNVGFQPVGLFLSSFNRVAGDTIDKQGEISIGAASSSTAQGAIWGEDKDVTITTSNTAMSITTNSVIRLASPATTVNAEAAFVDFITNGFRLNWTTVDATARQIVGWTIGSNSTIVGNNDGTGEPANVTLAPGAGATTLDAFTLKTSAGSDTVTAVTVALSSGSSGGLSLVEITSDDGSTVYGSVSNPASDTVAITVTGMPTVTTTPAQYKVRITPKPHTGAGKMPDPPGSTYTVTGTVTAITCTYPKVYNDTASATITIDNDSPDDPSGFSGIPGDTQVILTWANPGDADFSEVVILRSTSTIADTPVEGTQYYQNDPIGTNGTVVRYVGSLQTFTDTELTNGWNYYYKIFAKDSNGNYSTPGTTAVPYPCIPWPVVTANYSGSQIGTINNGTGDQYIGAAFTFQQSSGTAGNITALTISETGNVDADAVLSDVKVYYESGVDLANCLYNGGETLITTTSFNTSDKIVLSSIIPITLSPNFTCVYVVFDVGDSVDRSNPYVELEITSSADFTLSGSLVKAGTYPVALPLTTTLNDTHPPGDVSGQTATVGNTELILNWTNPSGGQYDDDYAGVRIRRTTGATAPATCSSGTQVADVPSSSTSYVDDNNGLGLINGTLYSYRLCSYDENPGRLYSPGVTITSVTPSNEPTLTYPASPYNDGKNPDTGDTTVNFTFKVIYIDIENNAPASGYPKIYIGDDENDGYTSYTMSLDASAPFLLRDGNYSSPGEQYVYGPIGLGAAQDLKFYFEAQAVAGNLTVVKLPPTGYSTGPSVYLMNAANMVGVPKDLGDGLSYGSVLGDDSGIGYCIFWDSAGLDTIDDNLGEWSYCNYGIEKGKGYYIWAASADSYRLDEPDGVGNVTAASVDIALDTDGGWTMISNPYNVNIQLQNVKVIREGDPTEYTFSAAVNVPNEWIGNSIYEWEGSVTGYTFKAYNGSPPAILEPWVGFFIYVKDITTPTTLKVYKP